MPKGCLQVNHKMADGYTLAKLVDEMNYLRFTKRRSLEDIRRETV
ncbi:unnamed protein product [marine sediment metagenome]|uniref:Uncharacterized protein n=1 Tax=marine sediment metagenome TaxID=412755 RepID=X1CKP0_9ZZZZ